MTAYPMHYTRTTYEQEARRETIRKSLSWVVFVFLLATNMVTAFALITARNQVEACHERN